MTLSKIMNIPVGNIKSIWQGKVAEDYLICQQNIPLSAVKYIGGMCSFGTVSTPASTRVGDLILVVFSGSSLTTKPAGFTTIVNNGGASYNDMKISLGYKYSTTSGIQDYFWTGATRSSLCVFRGAYIKQSQYGTFGSTVTVSSPSITASAGSMVVSVCHYAYSPSGCTANSNGSNQISVTSPAYSAAWYRTYPTGGTTVSPNLKSREGSNYCTSATFELALS